jgi:hypothetical protein
MRCLDRLAQHSVGNRLICLNPLFQQSQAKFSKRSAFSIEVDAERD